MRDLRGSISIEAAVVVPICLVGTCILLMIILLYHDITVIKGFEHQVLESYCTLEPNYGLIYGPPISISEAVKVKKPMLFIGDVKDISYKISVIDYNVFKKVTVKVACPIKLMGFNVRYNHESEQIVTSGPEVVRLMNFFNDVTSDQVLLAQMKQYFGKAVELIEIAIKR